MEGDRHVPGQGRAHRPALGTPARPARPPYRPARRRHGFRVQVGDRAVASGYRPAQGRSRRGRLAGGCGTSLIARDAASRPVGIAPTSRAPRGPLRGGRCAHPGRPAPRVVTTVELTLPRPRRRGRSASVDTPCREAPARAALPSPWGPVIARPGDTRSAIAGSPALGPAGRPPRWSARRGGTAVTRARGGRLTPARWPAPTARRAGPGGRATGSRASRPPASATARAAR